MLQMKVKVWYGVFVDPGVHTYAISPSLFRDERGTCWFAYESILTFAIRECVKTDAC